MWGKNLIVVSFKYSYWTWWTRTKNIGADFIAMKCCANFVFIASFCPIWVESCRKWAVCPDLHSCRLWSIWRNMRRCRAALSISNPLWQYACHTPSATDRQMEFLAYSIPRHTRKNSTYRMPPNYVHCASFVRLLVTSMPVDISDHALGTRISHRPYWCAQSNLHQSENKRILVKIRDFSS